jgi:predicted DNA repair protein MutK
MNKRQLLILGYGVMCMVLGFAGGAEVVMRKVDALDAQRARATAADAKQAEEVHAQLVTTATQAQSSAEIFAAANAACRQQFSQGTLLYETPAAAQMATGLRSVLGMPVNLAPGANVSPRWWIPAKIKPQVYGPAQGAVYYYIGQDNRVDGPYLPAAAGAR